VSEPIFIDTHAHLDFPEYSSDLEAVIGRAAEAGIRFLIDVGTDPHKSARAVEIAEKYDGVFAAVGVHPHYAGKMTEEDWHHLEALVSHRKVVAIGEIGLDYYRLASPKDEQKALFLRLITLARNVPLPVIIHSRDAHEDTLAILKESAGHLVGVMHCFSGDESLAREVLEMGFYISFAGNITFPKAEGLRRVARFVPIERLLLETDSPFLAPQVHRGKRNEPAWVIELAKALAEIKDLSLEDVARITTLNAYQLFGVGEPPEKGKLVYATRDSLYINITNRCSNICTFCIRTKTPFVKGHHLFLERDPTAEEIIDALRGFERYREVVFCGFGEPTERLETLKKVARFLKSRGARIRLVTNGQGNLINGRPILGELKGLLDSVSISLNTADPRQYMELCRPRFGEEAFNGVIDFVKEAKKEVGFVEITAIDMPQVDTSRVRNLANELGVSFRLRRFNEVG